MKTLTFYIGIKLILLSFVFSSSAGTLFAQSNYPTPDGGTITYQTFYDDLSPYGNWINYPGYGNVWKPSLGADFRPYATNGQWVYTNDGWAWESNYNWGWAPFHYGRWLYDDFYGWLWIPGYEWSTAWVTWGAVDNYYCWAPLMPDISAAVMFNTYRPHSIYWNMVDRAHIDNRDIGAYLQHTTNIGHIQNNITIIDNYSRNTNNSYYNRGPQVGEVQRYTNRKVNTVNIRDVNKNNIIVNNNTAANNRISTPDKGKIAGSTLTAGKKVKNGNATTNTTVPASSDNEYRAYRPKVQQPTMQSSANSHVNAQRTAVSNAPQPREVRAVNTNSIRPIRSQSDNIIGQRKEQAENVDRLPQRTTTMAPTGAPRRTQR